MREQFVPATIAQQLKEKGFDQQCLAYYNTDPYLKIPVFNLTKPFEHEWVLPTPLWQQVIDWLREKHFIDIMIRQTQKDGTAYYKITKIETEDKIKGYSNFCKTVNIARQAAIEHALTLI